MASVDAPNSLLTPVIPRGPSAAKLLEMDWNFPVFKVEVPKEKKRSGSVAKTARYALEEDKAFELLSAGDTRPLLVLRECLVCSGTDDALLTPGADNEKTQLLSRWFRCVKLPPDVLQEDSPFHKLFPGKSPPHLFVSTYDGQNQIPLESDQSRTELWKAMTATLRSEYDKKPTKPLKELTKILDQFDLLDKKLTALEARKADVLEKDGPKSSKLKKIDRDLEKCRTEEEKLMQRVEKASDLGLKNAVAAGKGGSKKSS